jgi:hypothetical protein
MKYTCRYYYRNSNGCILYESSVRVVGKLEQPHFNNNFWAKLVFGVVNLEQAD